MKSSIIVQLSVLYTGTWRLATLLNLHPEITSIDFSSIGRENTRFKSPTGINTICNANIAGDLRSLVLADTKYILYFTHMDAYYILPAILHQVFDFKLVIPVRHPFLMLRTALWRETAVSEETIGRLLSQYLHLLYIVEKCNGFIYQIDSMKQLSQNKSLFQDYLHLEMTDVISAEAERWLLVNETTENKRRELSFDEVTLLNHKIELSGVLTALQKLGVNYET